MNRNYVFLSLFAVVLFFASCGGYKHKAEALQKEFDSLHSEVMGYNPMLMEKMSMLNAMDIQ